MSRKVSLKPRSKKPTPNQTTEQYIAESAQGLSSFKRKKISPIEAGIKAVITGHAVPQHLIDDGEDIREPANDKSSWEELEHLFNTIGAGFISIANALRAGLSNPQVFECIENKAVAVSLITTFFTDLDVFSGHLADIRAEHLGKVGFINSPEENNVFLNIAFKYEKLSSDWMALSSTTVFDLTEILGEAEQKYFLLSKAKASSSEDAEEPASVGEQVQAEIAEAEYTETYNLDQAPLEN